MKKCSTLYVAALLGPTLCTHALGSTVSTIPNTPTGCDPVVIQFDPSSGPLASASPVYIHIGRNGWQNVIDPGPIMTWNGTNWLYTYYPQPGTKTINSVFNDGGGTWDNNSGADWEVAVENCSQPDHPSIASANPVITSPSGTNQNEIGEYFDLSSFEGTIKTVAQGGFGSFGKVYINSDTNFLYLGGREMSLDDTDQFIVLFLDVNTLSDDRLNLWDQNGLPNGIDHLHNVQFESPMDIGILIGSEFGDGIYTNFDLTNGTNVGQGLFYLSDNSFTPVGGALLTQFDSVITASADDDGNEQTDHWKAAIPWASLNANGIDDISVVKLCGVITSTKETGNDRYLSSNFLGTYSSASYVSSSNQNVGFNFMHLTPVTVIPPARISGEQILSSSLSSLTNVTFSFNSPGGARHRIYKGSDLNNVAFYSSITSGPPSQKFTDMKSNEDTGMYAAATQPDLVNLKLINFNIRYGSADDGANNWSNRRDQVYALMNRESAQVIGIQEAERFQLDEIHANVPGYSEVGEARNGGTSGEYSCIFYKTDLFTLLDSDTFWLSDTPDIVGSMSWGNTLPRICTWAKLQHKTTGRILFVYNTHLDHASQNSREESIKLIVDRVATRSDTNRPFALTGDFNANEANIVVQYLRDLQALDGSTAQQDGVDMFDVFRSRHPGASNAGTIHGFSGSTTGDKIDYIFLSEGVDHYDARILHDNISGSYPSDHFPITSRFLLEW